MNKLKFELEILTPMRSFGENKKLEFRLTELKSLMRYTFRAIYEFENLKTMRLIEEKLFGSINIKSPFTIRLINKDKLIKEGNTYLLPHREISKRKAEKRCIIEKTIIKFVFISKENLEFYSDLLIISSIIGGLGQRSRRGLGSFIINSVNDEKINIKKNGEDNFITYF